MLPAPPQKGVSRIDTLPDSFVELLQRRPVLIGDVIAERYKIVQALGDGAMGQVFVAENLAIGKRVAIKVLKPELLADATFRQRFQHEAEAMAAIDHRNVARFLDLVVGDPTFLVMEYIKGQTLAARIREDKRLPPLEAVRIAIRLCWALETAHQSGVIHRDLKPANVILQPDPEGYEPKLIDFGLAKLSEVTSAAKLTRHGQIVGTPEYMSPEQIANQEIDGRSDVYSLACLLYEMVAGRPPFSGGDDVQLLYQQLQKPAEPITNLVPGAPPELWAALERALAKSPDDRFRSMRQMAEALEALLPAQLAMRTISVARPAQLPKWPLVATVVLGVALGWLLSHLGRSTRGGALLLTSRPAGARVEVDGRVAPESTPTMVNGLLPGTHAVRFTREPLQPVERQVSLGKNERAVVNVALPPPSRRIEVRSVPEGASVYLDGRLVMGVTPTTVEVTDDDFHELRVEKPGYESAARALTPEDKQADLSLPLLPERLPRATLFVDANTAAAVWVDGIDTGYTTPTLGIRITPGDHQIEVRDGSSRASATVHLSQGQTTRLLLSPAGAKAP
jgi:tRNA A-37 threonylcarbamoyl transferase component Bud32